MCIRKRTWDTSWGVVWPCSICLCSTGPFVLCCICQYFYLLRRLSSSIFFIAKRVWETQTHVPSLSVFYSMTILHATSCFLFFISNCYHALIHVVGFWNLVAISHVFASIYYTKKFEEISETSYSLGYWFGWTQLSPSHILYFKTNISLYWVQPSCPLINRL